MKFFLICFTIVAAFNSNQRQDSALIIVYTLFFAQISTFILLVTYYNRKAAFLPYLYLTSFLQYSVFLLNSELTEAQTSLNRLFRPFKLISSHPYSFLANSVEELLISAFLVFILILRNIHLNSPRCKKEMISFIFTITVQDFTYYSTYNLIGVTTSESTSNGIDLFGVFLSACYIISIFVYLGFLCVGYKKNSELVNLYTEDFPKCLIYFAWFLGSLIIGPVVSALLKNYDLARLSFLILLELNLVTLLLILRKNSRKKCYFAISYHLTKLLLTVLIILLNTHLLSQETGYWVFIALLYSGVIFSVYKTFIQDHLAPEAPYVNQEISPSNNIEVRDQTDIHMDTNFNNEYPEWREKNTTFSFERPVNNSLNTTPQSNTTSSSKFRRSINLITVKRVIPS